MSGGLSTFEELAAPGNPWRRKQPAHGSAADPDRLSAGAVAGGALTPAAASAGSMPNSLQRKVEAGHLKAQHPARGQKAGQELETKSAAELPGNNSGSIAAGWSSAQRTRASADLTLEGSAKTRGTVITGKAVEHTHPVAASKAGIPQQQQQQPATVLTSTSMQLALRLRDYCELIRSVSCVILIDNSQDFCALCMQASFSCQQRPTTHVYILHSGR